MTQKTVIEAVRDAMREEMRRDERVFIMGEDIGQRGGVFLASDGFLDEFGEQRVIDTPLAESSIAGIALGAALSGMRPIAEIEFADFIWPAINQLVGEAARVRYGTYGKLGAPMVVRAPYGGGVRGALYHSQSVEVVFAHTPGLKVVTPATPYDAKGLLKSAIRDDDPVIFLEHKRTYRLVRGEVPDEEYTLPIGQADVKRAGEDVSVITYGLMLHHCLEAAEALAAEGVSAEVVDLRSLRPLDADTVLASVRKTGKALIVHEDTKMVGIGGEVAAIISEEAFEHLDAPVRRLAGPEVPAMPFAPPLEAEFMLDTDKIAAAIRALGGLLGSPRNENRTAPGRRVRHRRRHRQVAEARGRLRGEVRPPRGGRHRQGEHGDALPRVRRAHAHPGAGGRDRAHGRAHRRDRGRRRGPGTARTRGARRAGTRTARVAAPAGTTGVLLKDVAPVGPTGSGGVPTSPSPQPRRQPHWLLPPPRLPPRGASAGATRPWSCASPRSTTSTSRCWRAPASAAASPRRTCSATSSPPLPRFPSLPLPPRRKEDETRLPLTPTRRLIAAHMTRSATEIPQAWSITEVDVSGLVARREALKDGFREREGVNLTYLPFVLKAVAEALKENPLVNSSWGEDAIILKRRINIGIAVAAPAGLIVPVLHDADAMSVSGLARRLDDLTRRARAGELTLDEVQGGTFTLNNTGALGSVASQPIINHPQAAILTTEAILKLPVVVGDAIAIRSMMNICFTFDHRIMDGAEASAFTNAVKHRLEAIGPHTGVY